MRLLDRYLLRELLVPFAYCLSAFWIFWTVFDIFGELEDFQDAKLGIAELVFYYVIKTPELLVVVLPMALLLSLLYALTTHARHHELTAIRAAGVGLWRIALPYLAVGFVLSLAIFAMNELWLPQSLEATEQILKGQKKARAGQVWERKLGFANTRHNRTWLIEAYNTATHVMLRPFVEWKLDTGTRLQIWAERAFYRDGKWVFTNVQERTFPAIRGEFPTVTETNLLVMEEFSEKPQEILSALKISRIDNFKQAKRAQLSIREILSYKRLHVATDTRPRAMSTMAMLDTKLQGRLAAPWTCLVVVLIALPFGAMPGRRNVFVGVASSIVICFGYFVLMEVGLGLGSGGYIPPWLAAWAPNAIFAVSGVVLTFRVR
jgi:lipopolysaccharide export system permease protein